MNVENEDDVLSFIETEIKQKRLVLPTLPDIALKVKALVSQDNISSSELTTLIASDAALSARLIQVVNSPLYRARTEITSLKSAIARLGFKALKFLVTSLVIQQVFAPPAKVLETYFRKSWEQSIAVSSLSRAIAMRYAYLDAEEAMLGGLIHQIGKLPLFSLIEKHPQLLKDTAGLDHLIMQLHPRVGKLIMESWEFPEAIRSVAWDYLNFSRDSGDKVDYIDIVQAAFLEAVLKQTTFADYDYATLSGSSPAFIKIKQHLAEDLDNEEALLKQQIEQTQQLLKI